MENGVISNLLDVKVIQLKFVAMYIIIDKYKQSVATNVVKVKISSKYNRTGIARDRGKKLWQLMNKIDET